MCERKLLEEIARASLICDDFSVTFAARRDSCELSTVFSTVLSLHHVSWRPHGRTRTGTAANVPQMQSLPPHYQSLPSRSAIALPLGEVFELRRNMIRFVGAVL